MYTYWVLLSLGLLPLIYAHCLDTGDPGMPISRWTLVLAAFTWVLLFSPLPQPDEVTVAVSLMEVVWVNLVSVISADLLWSQVETYTIGLQLVASTSMLTAIASCVVVALLHLMHPSLLNVMYRYVSRIEMLQLIIGSCQASKKCDCAYYM